MPDHDDLIDLLKQLLRHPSVVGSEHSFYRVLRRELDELGLRVTLYEGLLVAQGTMPQSLLVSTHVDRHGLVCTGPGEFQYAAYVANNRGDLTGESISEQTYRTMAGRFAPHPLIAYEPWSGAYLGSGSIRNSYLCERRGNVFFEIEGLDHLVPGTPVAYQDRLGQANGSISGQLDNALSVALLVHLCRCGFQGTAFFTAQEEAGRSWRFLLEWFRRHGLSTDRLIVLDTSPFPDEPAAGAQDVVLRRRDTHAAFDEPTVERLESVCRSLGFRYAFKDEVIEAENARRGEKGLRPTSIGSTELGRLIAASKGAIRGSTLQVPTTGFHTPDETARLSSVLACLEALLELVRRSGRE